MHEGLVKQMEEAWVGKETSSKFLIISSLAKWVFGFVLQWLKPANNQLPV